VQSLGQHEQRDDADQQAGRGDAARGGHRTAGWAIASANVVANRSTAAQSVVS
jgi:hypothetical protein